MAVVGAGGIGFDVAEYVVQEGESPPRTCDLGSANGASAIPPRRRAACAGGPATGTARAQVTLLQRKAEKPGKRLGKTTGWIHRASLRLQACEMIGGVNYDAIDAEGLHVSFWRRRARRPR